MKEQKIFVLDTSVILYDHQAINNFEEHDVVIPIHVLEEVDKFKKGNETINFEARGFIRFLDTLAKDRLISDWIPLNGDSKGRFKVVMNYEAPGVNAEEIFQDRKYDHKILNSALAIQQQSPDQRIILVSKDISLRLKAKALNLPAEDYETGKIKDPQKLDTGKSILNGVKPELIDRLFREGAIEPHLIEQEDIPDNHFYILRNGTQSVLSYYNAHTQMMENINKQTAFGIKPKNAEQTFALHALMNPNIKLMTIMGVSGTGKTLLTLASALEQRKNYRQIFVTRPIVPLSNKDIGFLPGDIKSKLNPYMEPLWDNLKYIKNQFGSNDKQHKTISDMLESEKISIAPLAYIRGRSLAKVFFIVDEAQNLTPHEVKTIISRAGENTKIVFTGDIFQIDTPYLDAESNGLSYLIDRVKSHPLFAHITLDKGERSDLANLANELL